MPLAQIVTFLNLNIMYKKYFNYLAAALFLSSCSPKINSSTVLNDLQELSDDKYEGRKTGTKGADMAAELIINRFKTLGVKSYTTAYKQAFNFKTKTGELLKGNNIIGYIQGKTDEVMVISAHYDHLGIIKGKVFNGADDDASGVCAVLAYADYFSKHQPQHTLIFVAFDAEEMGHHGSKYFVENPPVDLKKIVLNINLDMIAHNDKNELYASGTFHFPELKQFIFLKNAAPKILFGHDDPKTGNEDWTYQGDHDSFLAKKIPYIYFGVEDHKDYHKETDEFKNINQEFYSATVKTILEVIKNLDTKYSLQKILQKNTIMN
jgi:Zn-dependent M28 family amino/carboxypeptidase